MNEQVSLNKPTRLKGELAESIRSNYSPETHGVLYNFSGHGVPGNFKTHLRELGVRTFSKFEAPCHISQDEDLWDDCIQLVRDMSEMTCPILDKNSLECPGKKFLFLPANSGAASLLVIAMSRLLVVPPYLVRVRYDFAISSFSVESVINLQSWDGFIRKERCNLYRGASAGVVEVVEAPTISSLGSGSAKVIKLRSKS